MNADERLHIRAIVRRVHPDLFSAHPLQRQQNSDSLKVVAPGDHIMTLPDAGELRISSALQLQADQIISLKPGVLKKTDAGRLWVDGRNKRYIPTEGDVVVGVSTERYSENFQVDIGGPFIALLPQLAFEGATKRNKQNLQAGDVVYARVTTATKDAEPVLSCMDVQNKAAGFGHLKEGLVFQCSTSLCRTLLSSPPCPVLQALGSELAFELAVGMNGRVWVNSPSPATTILIASAIPASEFLTETQTGLLVKKLLARVLANPN